MRVAILGTWHVHAVKYVKTALALGEVVGVYEENALWRREFAEKFNLYEFSSLGELLSSDCEGVIVCTSTNKHAEYITAAARAGKHIFTEKVLALTEEECLKIKAAIEECGVRFVIAYQWKRMPGIMAAKSAVDEGLIGKVNYLRFRNCHSGSVNHWLPAHFYNEKECGGGAMIDLGAHGMYLADWFLGEPKSYMSSFTHFCSDGWDKENNPSALEDNAITVMTYEGGAIAVNETGFVSVGSPAVFEVGGDLGYIVCKGNSCTVTLDRKEPKELPLPEGVKLPEECFLTGEEICGCGIDEAITLTKMMVEAYKNCK